MNSSDARTLANHIRSIPRFNMVTYEVPYEHMGATLVDGVFQAGVNYVNVVLPRVDRMRRDFPEARTTSGFWSLLSRSDLHALLRWKGERSITTLLTLTELLLDHDVETEEEFLAFLDDPGSRGLVTGVRGIGPKKTFQYLRFLAGAKDAVAVDRHMWRTLEDAGIKASTFDEAHRIYREAALLLGVSAATLEYSVFLYGASGGRKSK